MKSWITLFMFVWSLCSVSGQDQSKNETTTIAVVSVDDCSIASFPYKEGFEISDTEPCWSYLYYGESGEMPWKRTTFQAHSGSYSFVHEEAYVSGRKIKEDGWLISPKFEIPATGVHQLSFWSTIRLLCSTGKK